LARRRFSVGVVLTLLSLAVLAATGASRLPPHLLLRVRGGPLALLGLVEEVPCEEACMAWRRRGTQGHRIRNERSGRCLDWNEVIVKSKLCTPSGTGQVWKYEVTDHIQADSRCLDAGGSRVHVWTCADDGAVGEHQRWHYDVNTGQIRSKATSEMCLEDSSVGQNVSMRPCNASLETQHWSMHSLARHGQLKHQHGLCLDAGGSRSHMWHCDTANKMQHWTWHPSGPLMIPKGGCLDGSSLRELRPCDGGAETQRWSPDFRTGLVRLENGSCLAAVAPGAQGSSVRMEACDPRSRRQQWLLSGLEQEVVPPSPKALLLIGACLAGASFVCAMKALYIRLPRRSKAVEQSNTVSA